MPFFLFVHYFMQIRKLSDFVLSLLVQKQRNETAFMIWFVIEVPPNFLMFDLCSHLVRRREN